MQDSELQRLVADVKAGRCALILGPEIFTTENGQGIQAYIRAQLFERFGEQIAAYYERDGFFLLKSPEDKPEMQDEVQHLYKSLRPAEDLLRQIVEVPFSLVLSVNPDTWLRDLSFRYGLPNRFAWFDPRKQEDLDVPDGSEAEGQALRDRIPLYYNLCGSVDRLSTLLLDYDDLYRLLEGMLGAPKLPEKLLARLKDTTSYLFLGFQFDRWHTQLMLRLLDVKNAPRRFAIQSPVPKEKDTEAFIISQFRIKFLGEEADLLHRLHAAFAAEGLLRHVDEGGAPARNEVTAYLQKGNLEKALGRLQDAAKGTPMADTATLLSSQYQLWLSEKNKGTLDTRDIALQFNQLTDRILQAAKQL
jgi:Effector-associated domain 11/SIR2-like domain